MSDRGHQLLYRAAHAAARTAGAVPDADLVRQLTNTNDRAAFELLLWRHGPAVWGVCRRVLGPTPDAEDAFQATFLALSRRAGTIGDGNAVAGWLHRVAVRAAVAAAKDRARRIAHEAPTPVLPEAVAPDDPVRAATGRELGAVLDAAIARLPDRYRRPFLLCEVYGRGAAEAAAELNCPIGTIASRLSRARRRLRSALARHGLALPATLAVAVLPAGLAAAAIRSAFAPAAGSKLVALADRAAGPVLIVPWKLAAAACLVAASAGFLARAQPKTPPADKPPPAAAKKADIEVGPIQDDPLPEGAVARIGSTRLRHAGAVYDVAFSPDGKWIATAGTDGAALVWDAATGERRFKFPAAHERHLQIAFMDQGKALWVYSPDSAYIDGPRIDLQRFSLADGHKLPENRSDSDLKVLFGFAFDPAGKRFGYVHYAGMNPEFRVLDAGTGKSVATLPAPAQWSMRAAFAPGGHLVAFPPGGGQLGAAMSVRDVATGTEVASLADAEYSIGATAFAPDGKILASICDRPKEGVCTVAVWDATTGKFVRRITSVELTASCLAFSPDGKSLAVGNTQRQAVQLFEVATGKEVRRFRSSPSVMRVAFSPDGKRLAAARTTGTVSIWDVETGKPTAASADPDQPVTELRFLDRDRLLAKTGAAVVHDWRTGKVLERSVDLRETAFDYTFVSPDRRLIAAPDWPGPIRLHDAATGAEVKRLEGHTVLAEPVVFSPDGTRLYSRGHDQTVRGWDVGTAKELFKADFGHASSGDQLAVSPDGKRVAASTREEQGSVVQVWDTASGKEGPQFHLPKGHVARLAFSPDGATLAAAGGHGWFNASEPGWVVLWDLATGTVRRTLTDPNGFLVTLAFTSDGRSVVTGGVDGVVRVWELTTGRQRRAFKGHQVGVYTLAVSPDGRYAASGSPDVPTLVWDLYATTAGPLPEAEGKKLLADLEADAATGFAAVRRLTAHPAETVRLLRANLKPAPATDPKRIQELVKELDADRFAVREKAVADLQKLGDEAEPAVRSALAASPSAEARERLTALLPKVGDPSRDRLRELRAVEALEVAGTPEAATLLGEWAKDRSLRIRPDAAAARERMGKR